LCRRFRRAHAQACTYFAPSCTSPTRLPEDRISRIAKLSAVTAVILGIGAAALWTPDLEREVLEARYAASPSRFLTVAGLRVHLRDTGPRNAPTVLLLHGFGSSLQTWDDWAADLERDYRVVRFDLPGAGLTGEDSTGNYSDDRSVQIITGVLDSLGITHATLVGNSLGGRIAWYFAAMHPERVDRLLLVSPDGFASVGFEYGKAPEVPAAVALMRYVLPKPLMRAALAPAYADRSRLSDSVVTRYYELLLAPGVRHALLDRLRQSVLQPPEPLLRRITAPTMLLWGVQDSLIPFTNSADYLRVMPQATLVPMAGVGHVPQEERPIESVAEVRRFLQQ
jgi:pimeloyl-ACP methyl ester carboxylesterase